MHATIEFPKPTDSSQLSRFLGIINCYRGCIPHATQCQTPLSELVKGRKTKQSKVNWTPEAELCIRSIASAATTALLGPSQLLALRTDASYTALGTVLDQQRPNAIRISFRGNNWTPSHLHGHQILSAHSRRAEFHHSHRSPSAYIRTSATACKASPRQSR